MAAVVSNAPVIAVAPAAPVTAAAPAQATQKVGKYILGRTLGEGAFSIVKLGVHEETKDRVAVKILKKKGLNMSAGTKKQVEREIAAMSKVKHPNVIQLVDVDWQAKYTHKDNSTEDALIVILELATGGELFDFLSFTGSFDEPIARAYFRQLMAGVECCHEAKVYHRDLKPENLLLSGDFLLKLADFGLSNTLTQDAADNLMYTECGTTGYMAPELFLKTGYDPAAADIWSCGVILFICLAGFPPFQKPANTDWWFNKLSTGKHALFWQAHCRTAFFSDNSKDLLNKMLQPDPSKRITIDEIKKHAWYKDKVISDADLVTELKQRKETVDEERVRAQLEKKQSSTQADVVDSMGIVRGSGIAIDLPNGVPSMFLHKKLHKTSGSGLNLKFSNSLTDAFGQKPKLPSPQVYDPTLDVECYSRFQSTADPSKVMSRLKQTFGAFNAKLLCQEPEYRIKAELVTETGAVVCTSQVFANPDDAKQLIVELRRRKGDPIQFRQIYNSIVGDLGDVVYKPPVAVTPVAAAPAVQLQPASPAAKPMDLS